MTGNQSTLLYHYFQKKTYALTKGITRSSAAVAAVAATSCMFSVGVWLAMSLSLMGLTTQGFFTATWASASFGFLAQLTISIVLGIGYASACKRLPLPWNVILWVALVVAPLATAGASIVPLTWLHS